MTERDFFVAMDEAITETMDEVNNTNYGLVKENITKLSKIVSAYKKSLEARKEMASKCIDFKIADKVCKIIEEKLGKRSKDVQLNSCIAEDLGADSLDVVELTMAFMAFEDAFNIEIPDEDAENIKTVRDAIVYLSEKI